MEKKSTSRKKIYISEAKSGCSLSLKAPSLSYLDLGRTNSQEKKIKSLTHFKFWQRHFYQRLSPVLLDLRDFICRIRQQLLFALCFFSQDLQAPSLSVQYKNFSHLGLLSFIFSVAPMQMCTLINVYAFFPVHLSNGLMPVYFSRFLLPYRGKADHFFLLLCILTCHSIQHPDTRFLPNTKQSSSKQQLSVVQCNSILELSTWG